ncbi:type II toxin-antitoxin system prevent-host-death family antitoxin [Ereboglobus sp. PH5-5]|uniref:type II toxin-antitoxin system Phd/YefM family antitoxin n=1 Tax=Ereboglobus sp. PH5-5 TaxID=2940529 RepID=UPI0024059C75|nr:type II toxin-antitoxin system prevent-host-death family antitoxin [Ereboglobus sp. PH5-5]
MSATDASKNFSELLHSAHYSGDVIIEKNGKPYAVVCPIRAPRTGAEIARALKRAPLPVLPPGEAESFAADLEEIRKIANTPPAIKW